MIREYLGKKAADAIDRSRFGNTKAGKISTVILDDERLEDAGFDRFDTVDVRLRSPYLRYRMVGLAIAVNAVSWLSVLLIPSVVAKLALACALILPKGGAWLLAPALGFTLMGVYSLLRIWIPERVYGPDDGAIMQSYGNDLESLRTWKLWLVSCGIAGINAILLAILYFVMTGEYEQYSG